MLCCHLVADVDKQDALVVRVFGQPNPAMGMSMDRSTEVMCLQVAAHIKIGQPVYAIFKNGIIYRYAPGRTLTGDDIKNPDVIR